MSTYTPDFLMSLLPPIMKDLDTEGDLYDFLSIFVDMLNAIEADIAGYTTFYRTKDAPSVVLDALASTFGVIFNKNFTEDQQRSAIAGAVHWYRKKGTIPALDELINSLGYTDIITEYFVDPFPYDIVINAGGVRNVTGVTVDSPSGVMTYNLVFTAAGTTLAWGGGTAVDVSVGGVYTLIAATGTETIRVTVDIYNLPVVNETDSIVITAVTPVYFSDISDYDLDTDMDDITVTGWQPVGSPILTLSYIWQDSTAYTATTSYVTQDAAVYRCVLSHTSNEINDKPGSGTNWTTYWILYSTPGEVKVGNAAIKFDKNNSLAFTGICKDFTTPFILKDVDVSKMRCECWVYLPPVYAATPVFNPAITGVSLRLSNTTYAANDDYFEWKVNTNYKGVPLQMGWNKISINLLNAPTNAAGTFNILATIKSVSLVVDTASSANLLTGVILDGLRFFSGGIQSPLFDVLFTNKPGIAIDPTIVGFLRDEIVTNKPVYEILNLFSYLMSLSAYLDIVASIETDHEVHLDYFPTLFTDQDLPPGIVLPDIIKTDMGLMTDCATFMSEIVISTT